MSIWSVLGLWSDWPSLDVTSNNGTWIWLVAASLSPISVIYSSTLANYFLPFSFRLFNLEGMCVKVRKKPWCSLAPNPPPPNARGLGKTNLGVFSGFLLPQSALRQGHSQKSNSAQQTRKHREMGCSWTRSSWTIFWRPLRCAKSLSNQHLRSNSFLDSSFGPSHPFKLSHRYLWGVVKSSMVWAKVYSRGRRSQGDYKTFVWRWEGDGWTFC